MLKTTKILVADDEPDLELLILQKFRQKIQDKEIEFVFAKDGIEALEMLQKDPEIEILITDIHMPRMDGLTLLSRLSQIHRPIKTVIVPPYGDMDSIRAAMNQGAFDFITRPFNLRDLELTILKTIEQSQMAKEALANQSRLIDIERELAVARNIQVSIIPHDFHPFADQHEFELLGKMIPAKHIGGDFFDFFKINGNQLAFTIADVSGKGIPAALFMTMSRGLLRALGSKNLSPQKCFQQMNEALALENDSGMFVTAFYGILNIQTGVVTYCNAGHNPPYLISPTGELKQIARQEGIALGVIEDSSSYVEKQLQLQKNDTLLLYTDGVTEAMNEQRQLYTEERFEKCLKKHYKESLDGLFDSIIKDIGEFCGNAEQSDDITLFALRYLQ